MDIVIFADQRFVRIFGLIADISIAQFECADAVCTNLLLIAGLAGITVNPACIIVLCIGTLTRQCIQAETALTGCGDTSCILTCPCFPACELGTVVVL